MTAYPHTRRAAIDELNDAGAAWANLKRLEEIARDRRDGAIAAAAAAGCTRREIARHGHVGTTRAHQIAEEATGARAKGASVDATPEDEVLGLPSGATGARE